MKALLAIILQRKFMNWSQNQNPKLSSVGSYSHAYNMTFGLFGFKAYKLYFQTKEEPKFSKLKPRV